MPYADLYIARKQCQAMCDLIVMHKGGWRDMEALNNFEHLTATAANAVDDLECKRLASAISELAATLFSAPDHAQWALGKTSGTDVLRLRILREITAFQGRLSYIESVRTGTELADGAKPASLPKRSE